jgi:hypothetical protein
MWQERRELRMGLRGGWAEDRERTAHLNGGFHIPHHLFLS